MIVVIGIGADGMAGLSRASLAELSRATVIYGSKRQLDMLDGSVAAVKRPWPSPMLPALHTLLDHDGDVHVVASGDPLLHGVGNSLIRIYGPERVAVLPHVSSVTLACSRVGWAVQDTEIISLVTAPTHTALEAHLEKVNSKFARVEQVKKIEILPHDLSQEGGELTPTMKVKRNIVTDKYAGEINALYGS